MCVPQEIKVPRRKVVRGNTYRHGLIINFNLINTREERKRERKRKKEERERERERERECWSCEPHFTL